MARFLLIITAILLNIPSYSQEYFNKRFEYDQPGAWDGSKAVFILSDGYVLSGVTGTGIDDPWPRIGFYKIDFSGNKIFSKVYGDTMTMYFLGNPGSIIRFNDSIIVVSGSTKKFLQNMEYNEGLLLFMTNSFDTLFTKSYGDKVIPKDTSYILNQVQKVDSTKIITVGTKQFSSYSDKILLIKMDYQGNPIWEKTYGYSAYYQGHSVICTTDGGYAVGGFAWAPSPPPNYSGDPIIIKTDSAGNLEWMKNVGGPYPDNVAMLTKSIDGNIIIGTSYCDSIDGGGPHADGNPFRRINIIKIDNSGTILWDKKYGKSEYFKTLFNIRTNNDGSLIATGVTHISKEFSSKDLGWILKTTADGDSLWYREYAICDGEDSDNWLLDVIESPDNGYLACGVVYPMPPDTGSQDGWVIKVDSLGCESPGNCWVGMKPQMKPLLEDIMIYPNPAQEQVNFIIRMTKEEVRIELIDVFGRKVKELKVPEGIEKTILNISDLPGGLYMIRAETRDGIFGKGKLVVE